MTAGDRIAAVALIVSVGLFLHLTSNGRFESLDAVFEAHEDRIDRLDARDARVDEVMEAISEIPTEIQGLPSLVVRVGVLERPSERFEQIEQNQADMNRRLVDLER